jgi:Bacterial alpha-L-rhamnosidase 6 hairpin glycosidase domain/Bacterial alpha-L-rhamnosidase C-terminal domain
MRPAMRALLALGVTTAALVAAGPAAATSGGPWSNPQYQPKPGDWQPYVLAPAGHEVTPVSVLQAPPRGGSIQGNPAAALGHGGSVTLVSTGSRTASPLLILDFGKEVAGQVQVHVTGASATRPALHACFSESRAYMALSPSQNDGEAAYAPGCDTANIWNGYPGQPYTWDSDSHTLPLSGASLPATLTDPVIRGGFRYLTLFLDGPGSVTISGVSLKFTAAPLQSDPAAYKGWFESSDNTLNRIWYAGAYTVQVNTTMSNTAKSWPYSQGEADQADSQIPHGDPAQEVILDGGKRDRDVWQGDLSVQAPVTYLSTDDTGAVDNSLSALAAQQLPNGYVPAEGLVGPHNTGEETSYGEYVTWFINNMAVHYLYTGDRAYLAQRYPALTKAMAWLESVRAQDPQGLISFASGGNCGHYAYGDCGHETYINALYYRNLTQMATLAGAEGQSAAAAQYRTTAEQVKSAINSQLWNASVGAYELSRETPDVFPQDANATAILTGIADHTQATRALAYLRSHDWTRIGSLTVGSANPVIPMEYEPLPMAFEAEARLTGTDPTELGYDTGLQLISRYWGWNLSQDPQSTFWEKANTSGQPSIGSFTSLAHGWAAGPTVALTTQVLGVSPTTAGFAHYAVTPHPGGLAWAQGAVPTPHGAITASWQHTGGRFALNLTAPAGTIGTVGIPTFGAPVKVWVDGRLAWNAGQSEADGAHTDGTFVYLDGIAPGRHVITSQATATPPAQAQIDVVPPSSTATPGTLLDARVTFTGESPGRLTGTVAAAGPNGWEIEPAAMRIDEPSDGRPVSRTRTFYIRVPDTVAGGTDRVTFTFTGTSGLTAAASTTVTVTNTTILYGFEDGTTQGWTAGTNTSSVSAVSSFANGPGAPYDGNYALGAACSSVSADSWHTIQASPAGALNLSAAKTFSLQEDSYGGAPGATSYQTTVTLTAGDGQTLSTTQTTKNDTWNEVDLDVSSWPDRTAVTGIAVSFRAVGSTYLWGCQYQIDDVRWSG